jgi:AraC family transcriptional regulator
MHQTPRLVERGPGNFIGIRMEMSLLEDKTNLLWRSFMSRRHEVMRRTNTDFVSLQVYPGDYFQEFDPMRRFEKWALVEVELATGAVEDEFWNSSAEKGGKEERGGGSFDEDEFWNSSAEKGGKEERGGGIPEGMETYYLKGGLYAVFAHRGGDPAIFDHIYGEWLPASDFDLDNRPHFEVLDARYRHSDPEASEEIWIPVRLKD